MDGHIDGWMDVFRWMVDVIRTDCGVVGLLADSPGSNSRNYFNSTQNLDRWTVVGAQV